jgi:hypothetical protein
MARRSATRAVAMTPLRLRRAAMAAVVAKCTSRIRGCSHPPPANTRSRSTTTPCLRNRGPRRSQLRYRCPVASRLMTQIPMWCGCHRPFSITSSNNHCHLRGTSCHSTVLRHRRSKSLRWARLLLRVGGSVAAAPLDHRTISSRRVCA